MSLYNASVGRSGTAGMATEGSDILHGGGKLDSAMQGGLSMVNFELNQDWSGRRTTNPVYLLG